MAPQSDLTEHSGDTVVYNASCPRCKRDTVWRAIDRYAQGERFATKFPRPPLYEFGACCVG